MGMWLLWGNFALVDFTLWVSSIIMEKGNCSVTLQLRAKMHLKSPSVMAFLLVYLGILAYLCQNTSRDNDY